MDLLAKLNWRLTQTGLQGSVELYKKESLVFAIIWKIVHSGDLTHCWTDTWRGWDNLISRIHGLLNKNEELLTVGECKDHMENGIFTLYLLNYHAK